MQQHLTAHYATSSLWSVLLNLLSTTHVGVHHNSQAHEFLVPLQIVHPEHEAPGAGAQGGRVPHRRALHRQLRARRAARRAQRAHRAAPPHVLPPEQQPRRRQESRARQGPENEGETTRELAMYLFLASF